MGKNRESPKNLKEAEQSQYVWFRWDSEKTWNSCTEFKLDSKDVWRVISVGKDDNVVRLFENHSTGRGQLDRYAMNPENSAEEWVMENYNIR